MTQLSQEAKEWLLEWINSTGNDPQEFTRRLMNINHQLLNEFISEQYKHRQLYHNIQV